MERDNFAVVILSNNMVLRVSGNQMGIFNDDTKLFRINKNFKKEKKKKVHENTKYNLKCKNIKTATLLYINIFI